MECRPLAKILAISGSLRAQSSNRLLVELARTIAQPGQVELYEGLNILAPFNPDLDTDGAMPSSASDLRTRAERADAFIVSVPEYAHGLPGSFKNALDWLVGSTALVGKPVAIWSSTTRAMHAPAQLREILATMAAQVIEDACLTIEQASRAMMIDELLRIEDVLADTSAALRCLLQKAIRNET
jgi:chromate reductase, NAD(P)H dehydrogenase (quinone)